MSLEENKIKFSKTDPDTFPIYKTTYEFKSLSDYKSIFEILDSFNQELEELIGFNLKVNKSKIYHQDSQEGLFLSCKKTGYVLPGTLLGFYPGVIFNSTPPSSKVINDTLPYLKRFDDFWVNPNFLVPFPLFGCHSIEEFLIQNTQNKNILSGDKKNSKYETNSICEIVDEENIDRNKFRFVELPLYKYNPLALGNKINHPPPDKEANVKLIDFFVPKSFFPEGFKKYLPNLPFSKFNESIKRNNQDNDFYSNSFRLVGVVSTNPIKDKEELYLDYM